MAEEACWCSSPLLLISTGLAIFTTIFLVLRSLRMSLAGRAILITGCDSGFGNALAHKLDALGARVFATCLSEKNCATLRAELSERACSFVMDVTKDAQVADGVARVKAELGSAPLWGLVNNAGVAGVGMIELCPMEHFKWVAEINLWGILRVSKAFLPLIRQGKGRVVNVTSIAGTFSGPGMASYNVSKFGAEALSDALRREMLPWGVKVSIIEPGFFKTEITRVDMSLKMARDNFAASPAEVRAEYGEDFLERCTRATSMMEKLCRADISPVVGAMVHALSAHFPRPRYVIGWDALLMWRPMAVMHASITDFFITREVPGPSPKK